MHNYDNDLHRRRRQRLPVRLPVGIAPHAHPLLLPLESHAVHDPVQSPTGQVRQEELLVGAVEKDRALDSALLAEIAQVMSDASICGLGHTAGIAIRSAIDLGLVEAT